MSGSRSRNKGKRGELEFCHALESLGIQARRSQQFCGADGTADVLSSLEGVHWEVKRYSRISAVRFLEQAEADSLPNDVPVVAMREDRGEWVVMLKLKELQRLSRKTLDADRA